MSTAHLRSLSLVTLLGLLLTIPASAQQPEALLAAAKQAHAEKNYPAAIGRFREYLARFATQPGADTARYGLAVCLLDGNDRNADAAMVELTKLLPRKTFADYPYVLYYAGLARREQGDRAADSAVARQRFEESAAHFRDAAEAFVVRVKENDWAVRARCDQAAMLLRLGKAREAREAVRAVTTEKEWKESRFLPLAHYHLGFACYLLGDDFAAGKSLSRTSVLTDEVVGTHARYLLGRVHQRNTKQDEREEARLAYQAVLRDHEAARLSAQQKLNQPADAETKAWRERLVKEPPDHVARARFYLAVMQYEDGRFGEALEHFKAFAALHPKSPLVGEARVRVGFCQLHMKQPGDALRTLTQRPLTELDQVQAARALHGMGRAQLAMADAKKPEMQRAAIEGLKKAAEHPRARRGEVLADLVEAYQLAGRYKEAVNTCATILREKLLPARAEEMTMALAALQQLAGDYAESEKTCAGFLGCYKDSQLTPAVLFRQAENSARLGKPDEAAARYAELVARYPDSANAHLARLGLGLAYYHKGDLERAQKTFEAIPAADRTGELADVSYRLADLYLRQLPVRADDAVAAGKLEEKLKSATEALDAYLSAVPEGPQVPDALLKLGYCHGRMARLLAQPAEQQQALTAARAVYERIRDRHRGHAAYTQAMFERAKVLVFLRDVNRGINELSVFKSDALLKKSAVAPMALLHLATLQRRVNRPADAAATLAECRKTHDDALLQYHHAVALREAGKVAEAQALFDQVARTDGPEGWDAAVRAGQCRVELAMKKTADGRNQALRDAAIYFAAQERALRERKPPTEETRKARGRLLYESAWAWRDVAEEQARARYRELIKDIPDHTLIADARLELAELLAQRRENDEAIQLLQGALEGEREPPPELTDRIKLRLAACLLDRGSRALPGGKKDIEAALEQLQPLLANEKSPVYAESAYREAECHLQLGRLDDAIRLLSRFRDHGPLQRVVGVSDRALWRLGGALSEQKQWDQSRQAYEQLLGRFGASSWRFEARFGVGWAWQNQGRFDEAVGSYNQVVAAPGRLAGRAQFQVGACRMLQKRYKEASAAFQAAAAKTDDRELGGRALLEAARALQEDKQREQAVRVLRRVVADHAGSEHAESARRRLKELGES